MKILKFLLIPFVPWVCTLGVNSWVCTLGATSYSIHFQATSSQVTSYPICPSRAYMRIVGEKLSATEKVEDGVGCKSVKVVKLF